MNDLRYPIGRFDLKAAMPAGGPGPLIDSLAARPAELRSLVGELTDKQLDTPYRDGGWTIRQVVHHLPDSHLNAYIRMRWALTEDNPLIKAYNETAWAELPDASRAPVEPSLALLEALHIRWVLLLRSLADSDWQRTIQHPQNGEMSLATLLRMYEWHGRHHVAHIRGARERLKGA